MLHRRPVLASAVSVGLVVLLCGSAAAQPLALPESEAFTLDGPSGTYEITVTLPVGYDASSSESYPALYVLDGWWLHELATGSARLASIARRVGVEPFIVVSVGFEGDEAAWTRQRNRDLTPGAYRSPIPGIEMQFGEVVLDSSGTGGADAFLAFLQAELFPRVEAEHRADPARRGVLGHSFGGLFGAWVLARQPEVFDRYVLISPATWWRGGEAIEDGFGPARQLDRRVMVAVGEAEDGLLVRGVDALREALQSDEADAVDRVYPGADHTSVLPAAIWDGIVTLYGTE